MRGSVFKRCRKCAVRVSRKRCRRCGERNFTWAYVVDVGRDSDGKRRQRKRMGFETKRAAEHALREILSAIEDRSYVSRSDVTVAEYLKGEWLEATEPPHVAYKTWEDRAQLVRNHIAPRIGNIRLQKLNATHLNQMYSDLLEDGRVDGTGGLSATSVRRIHRTLRKAFRDAVKWGLLASAPTEAADPPPMAAEKAARRRSMTTLSEDELRAFLESTKDSRYHPIWYLAATTGLRRSEVLGLRWRDVDLDAQRLQVRQTIRRSEDGFVLEEGQKSAGSGRTIHLDERTVHLLRAQKNRIEELQAKAGAVWQDNNLVFPDGHGSLLRPDSVSKAFHRTVKRSDLVDGLRLHDLRHTHATLLLRAGVNPKVVSERLGHSSVAFTLDTYAHVIPGMQPEAAAQFSDLVFGGGDEQEPQQEDTADEGPADDQGSDDLDSEDRDSHDDQDHPDEGEEDPR